MQSNPLRYFDLRPERVLNRIGILIHSSVLFHHLDPLLKILAPDEADLVLYFDEQEPELPEIALKYPHRKTTAQTMLKQHMGYRYLISNQFMGFFEIENPGKSGPRKVKVSPIRVLGLFNVRMMYGLGADSWNLSVWNRFYDLFLCHGPWQARQLDAFEGLKLEMGYPRYDAFFNHPLPREALLEKYGLSASEPVIVWLPTLKAYYGTLEIYQQILNQFTKEFQILVKPHPHSWQTEAEFVSVLEGTELKVIRKNVDNLELFQLADLVLADYGGSAYGALYTDCPLILLDHPDYPAAQSTSPIDTDLYIRQSLTHLNPQTLHTLPALLKDADFWSQQKDQRARLRELFFTPNYGHSAQTAVDILRNLPQLLKKQPGS